MALNLVYGWSEGDELRVLTAANLPIGIYYVSQLQTDMNYMGANFPTLVGRVVDLLDEWDEAQTAFSTTNTTSGGKILTRADVLEWTPASPGQTYGPERELERIRLLLLQLFSFSMLFNGGQPHSTPLIRS